MFDKVEAGRRFERFNRLHRMPGRPRYYELVIPDPNTIVITPDALMMIRGDLVIDSLSGRLDERTARSIGFIFSDEDLTTLRKPVDFREMLTGSKLIDLLEAQIQTPSQ
ncbi:hypothetical protein HY025_03770 [Candidatus Daviesbacteria bacterium]|nr:hypothetical protein [Candidatus Daviesbacteria bacterium]